MRCWRWPSLIVSAVLPLLACQPDAPTADDIREYQLDGAHVVVPLESGLLANPGGLVTAPSGTVYVLDRMERRVLAVSADGEIIHMIGRAGSGPGEFNQPRALGVSDDRVYVLDLDGRAVEEFAVDGRHVSSRRVEMVGAPLSYSFAPDGRLAYTSFPSSDAGLVRILDASGREVGVRGNLVSEEPMQPEILLEQVQRGEVPGFMRNRALPVLEDDGTLWLFLQSEGVLKRFAPDGTLMAEATFRVPEMNVIERDFFDWYAGLTALGGIRFLDYLDAAIVVEGSPWLLWKVPLTRQGLITVHDGDGNIIARLIVSGLETEVAAPDPARPPPIRRFAVDPVRARLYLVDNESATLTWVSIPDEVVRGLR